MQAQRTSANEVPFPDVIPGEFFVLQWDRDLEQFVFHADDEEESTYRMTHDIQKLLPQMKRILGDDWLACQSIDVAREFGMAQVIPAERRVIPIKPDPPKRGPVSRELFDAEQNDNQRWCQLPDSSL